MPQPREVQEFAAHLRMLKYRAGRTYEALAKRSGVSSSALHRYCNGTSVPLEFAPLDRVARACGASHEELQELQRRWFLADATRKRTPQRPPDGALGHQPGAAGESSTAADDPATTATGTEGTGSARPRRDARGRPRWPTTGLVAAFLVVAAAAVVFGTALARRPAAGVVRR